LIIFRWLQLIIMPKILVAVATYNEIENLPKLVEAIRRFLPDVDLLVVDDNSPDGTAKWCVDQKNIDANFNCIIREGKLGLGTAVQVAMSYAISNQYEFLINMDADFSHPPEKLPELLAAMQNSPQNNHSNENHVPETPQSLNIGQQIDSQIGQQVDVTIGSRYVPGGKIEGWPFYRRAMSRLVNAFARICLGLPTRDNSGAYRCYRTATLERLLAPQIAEGKIRSKGYSFFEEILFLLHRGGANMVEIPITFVDRKFGRSKINYKEAVKAIGIIFRLGLTRLCRKRRE
jgi:Glycosyltransferases involved in cell wall biogenesis